jgi:oligopeptide/dipeptide ABC transporter ATP-binding protein
MPMPASPAPLLAIDGLTVTFATPRSSSEAPLRAVDDLSLEVHAGRTTALVGESGSGKSVTALSILRLLPPHATRIEARRLALEGVDLLHLDDRALRDVRGGRAAMVFQEPMTSLHPVYSVGTQIIEAIRLHRDMSRGDARARAIELLGRVGIASPETRVDAYPHELSGGMRQRVMIAMALSCEPKLLIADEPTTALDVTIQAQVLDLLRRLQAELGMGILFITHDLGVVAELAHDVAVMYAGQIVERGTVAEVFARPRHPYTRGLLRSLPKLVAPGDGARPRRLPTIDGMVPDLRALPPGCRFAPRCALAEPACSMTAPKLVPLDSTDGPSTRLTRCLRADLL